MKKFFLMSLLAVFAMVAKAQPDYVSMEPANNSTVGSLNKVVFTFDTSVVTDIYTNSTQGQKWPVYDASGKKVSGAYLCEADQQNMVVVLKFQPAIYKAGTYSVTVPSTGLQIFDTRDERIPHDDWLLTFTVDGTDPEPVVTAHFNPEPDTTVDYLAQITFTADGYLTYLYDNTGDEKIQVVNENGDVVASGSPAVDYGDENGENAYAIINLDKVITEDGDYMVKIPGSIYRLGYDWNTIYQGDYDMLPATNLVYTVENKNSTKYEVDYTHTSCVNGVSVTFPEHQTVTLREGVKSYTIYNAAGYWRGYTCTWDSLITTEGNKLNLKFNDGLQFPDTYNIMIPAGDLIFEDGSVNTPITLNIVVKEAEQTEVKTIPAQGSTIDEIYSLAVNFPNSTEVSCIYDFIVSFQLLDDNGDMVYNENGDDYYFQLDNIVGNTVNFKLLCGDDYATLTTPGNYQVKLNYGYFYLNADSTEVSSEIVIPFTIERSEDSHNYVNWGYYTGSDISTLGAIGSDEMTTYRVAIYLPGDGILKDANLSGARIPVRTAVYLSSLSAWVATDLNDASTYSHVTDIKNFHDGFNTIRFDENIPVPADGIYLGYDIEVDPLYSLYGANYCVVYDEESKMQDALWMQVPGYSWYDYGTTWGASALQGVFADLDISQPSAQFGSISTGTTQVGTTTDWKFPITVTNDEPVTNIEYTINVEGSEETRTAVANIPAGINQKGEVTVSITAPQSTGNYTVALTANKINGKENTQKFTTTSTFLNIGRTVTRHTLVEELTGTNCGWCPRGMVGLQKLKDAYGDKVICLASHQYDDRDPMYVCYIEFGTFGANGAPNSLIDRKKVADPYYGFTNDGDIVADIAKYVETPALADISLRARWTDSSCSTVQIESNLEALNPDTYEIAYVLTADGLTKESTTWAQHNYYCDYDASEQPEDLAALCNGGEYGKSSFIPTYNDVVIASSYDYYVNASGAQWTLADGQKQTHTYQIDLPGDELGEVVRENLDKISAVAIVLNSKGEVAQAAKVSVSEIMDGIHDINAYNNDDDANLYNVAGQRVNEGTKGIVIKKGKKLLNK